MPPGLDPTPPELTAAPRDTRRLQGIGVSPGVAHGPIVRMGDPLPAPSDQPSTLASSEELEKARTAMSRVAADLRARAAGSDSAARDVLEAQALMAEDPSMADDVTRRVLAGATAESAVWKAFGVFHEALRRVGGSLADRVTDLDDVRDRIVADCLGVALPAIPAPGYPFVLTARTLSPADTASLRADEVLAIVTVEGGPTSHTAILARSLGIPAVVGCAGITDMPDGTNVAVDGGSGAVERVVERAVSGSFVAAPRSAEASGTARASGGAVAEGVKVSLLANIGAPEEARVAADAGAEGVGLLRTEFLYLGAATPPTIDEQTAALRLVLAAFPMRPVVVRLLDAGGDKPLPFLAAADEPNPALGIRGLRALRAHHRILDEQLDAIARAAASSSAKVSVMAPMVTDAAEAEWFRERVLAHAGWHSRISIGVMVETPAAALTAESVVAASDFVSIGTNDLAQYVMAADRSVGELSALQSPWHPAILELVSRVAEAGRQHGKPVGVCGEAAADPLLALVLAGLGVTTLSMTWSALEDVRSSLARHSLAQCSALAAAALAGRDAADARARVVAARDSGG